MDAMHYDIWEIARTAVTDIIRVDLYSVLSGGVRNNLKYQIILIQKYKDMIQYILDENKNPVLEPDLLKWGTWMSAISKRRVAFDKINGAGISTVFLGLDHNFDGGPPILWETMVFGGELDEQQDRCSGGWKDAEAMHARMVDRVKSLPVLINIAITV